MSVIIAIVNSHYLNLPAGVKRVKSGKQVSQLLLQLRILESGTYLTKDLLYFRR